MSVYNQFPPNAVDQGIIPYSVRKDYFEEVLLLSPLSLFMGASNDALIRVIREGQGHGPSITFSLAREIDYKNPVFDFDQIEGTGQLVKVYNDVLTVRQQALEDILQGVQQMKMYTPIDVYSLLKPRLQIAHKRNLVYSIFRAGRQDLYPNPAVQGPVASRVVYKGVVHQANINAGVAGMNAGVAFNQNGLSVSHILQLRDMAIYGGAAAGGFETEKRINPYMLTTRKGFPVPTYVYLLDTPSYRTLTTDPQWNVYFSRALIENDDQPSGLVGSFYRGMIENVMIYEVPELGDYQVLSGGFRASWNLFCGAMAFGLGWVGDPWFSQVPKNHGTNINMAMLEIRGQKALMMPSYSNEATQIENGIIHSFVRIA